MRLEPTFSEEIITALNTNAQNTYSKCYIIIFIFANRKREIINGSITTTIAAASKLNWNQPIF